MYSQVMRFSLCFKYSFDDGTLPSDWFQDKIIPQGDQSTLANCRPISLTSVCCKVMKHAIYHVTLKAQHS